MHLNWRPQPPGSPAVSAETLRAGGRRGLTHYETASRKRASVGGWMRSLMRRQPCRLLAASALAVLLGTGLREGAPLAAYAPALAATDKM